MLLPSGILAGVAARAADLASGLGWETAVLKRRVRRLTTLGLTLSLRVGDSRSPRGEAFVRATGDRRAGPVGASAPAPPPRNARRRGLRPAGPLGRDRRLTHAAQPARVGAERRERRAVAAVADAVAGADLLHDRRHARVVHVADA